MILTSEGFLATPSVLQAVEDELLQGIDGRTMLWCGRGATALLWAYRLARVRRADVSEPEVIVPAISCASLTNTALAAGVQPRFADVDCHTGLAALEHIKAHCTSRTIAVVFIHLYGQTADLRPLAQWCRGNDITLIEDNAHALGARLPGGSPVGSTGDLSIYSFNRTKILECGGGALLVRRKEDAAALKEEVRNIEPAPPPSGETRALLETSYRNLHHSLVALMRLRAASGISELFLQVRPAYDGLYSRPMADPAALAAVWSELAPSIEKRRAKAKLYSADLAGGPWRLLDGWQRSGVCWRFSLLLDNPDELVRFSEAVRRDGFHVSNLYWPLNQFYRPTDACPNADDFARRIVNLWVDGSVEKDWVRRCAASLRVHQGLIARAAVGL